MAEPSINRSLNDISSLPVILIESWQHVQQRPYHRQKLVLIWSAEHFAEKLRGAGCQVTYTTSGDFETPLKAWIQAHQITDLRVVVPNDRPFLQLVQNLQISCKITLIPTINSCEQKQNFQIGHQVANVCSWKTSIEPTASVSKF